LTSAGTPADVFSDERRWWHFLEEGGIDRDSGWQIEMLSLQQAEALHGLITREFQRADLAYCLRSLTEVMRPQAEGP
jgi:hypothetical protein